MAINPGDHESVVTYGVGHSGGTLPSFTEFLTRGYWDGIVDGAKGNFHVAIQIDLTDTNTDTNGGLGLYDGFLRWVTGRPAFDGSTAFPTGEKEGDIWKEGFLCSLKQISPPTRMMNIKNGGDYGSLSGFNFAVINKYITSPLHTFLETQGYHLINRKIKAYIVQGSEFKQVWGGVVSLTRYNETVFEIIGKDIFLHGHTNLPPKTVTQIEFPNISDESVGKAIPVAIGDIQRSVLLNINSKTNFLDIGRSENNENVIITYARDYEYTFKPAKIRLEIYAPKRFHLGSQFINKFIRVVRGDSQIIRIEDAAEVAFTGEPPPEDSGNNVWNLTLERPITNDGVPFVPADFVNDHCLNESSYPIPTFEPSFNALDPDIWAFQIIDINFEYLTSNLPIQAYQRQNNIDSIHYYESNLEQYILVNELISDKDQGASNEFGFPFVKARNNNIETSEGLITVSKALPKSIFDTATTPQPVAGNPIEVATTFNDYDRATGIEIDNNTSDLTTSTYDIFFEIDSKELEAVNEVFVGIDFDVLEDNAGSNSSGTYTPGTDSSLDSLSVRIDKFILNPYSQLAFAIDATSAKTFLLRKYKYNSSGTAVFPFNVNLLPNDYYPKSGLNSEDSLFDKEIETTTNAVQKGDVASVGDLNITEFFLSDLLRISKDKIDNLINFGERARFHFSLTVPVFTKIKIKEVGVFSNSQVRVRKQNLYVKIKGEKFGTEETNHVYNTFRHILQTYDNFAVGDIDYNNLATTRNNWRVGRQIVEQNKTSLLLKNLAQSSFVGIYPTRQGKRGLISFLNQESSEAIEHFHNNQTIVEESIKRVNNTSAENVYNEMVVNYDLNPATDNYNRQMFIRNVEQSSFPDIGESTGTDTNRTVTKVRIYKEVEQYFAEITVDLSGTWTTNIEGQAISFISGNPGTYFSFGIVDSTEIGGSDRTVIVKIDNIYGLIEGTEQTGSLTVIQHSSQIPKWKTFVGGIVDYSLADNFWNICHNSYLRTKTINPLPEFLRNMDWFIDESGFDNIAQSDNHSARKYLELLLSWVTLQKNVVTYSIPMNLSNVDLELLQLISFKDVIYTNNVEKRGYITKIKHNFQRKIIELEVTLEPEGIEFYSDGLIIETGSNTNDIIESGSQTDNIVETGN